jgi:hypothetical protein
MEASQAGQGQAADAGQQQAQQGTQDGQAQASGLDALASQIGELGQYLRSEPWRPQEPEGGEEQQDEGLDLSQFLSPEEGLYDPQQQAQALQQALDQRLEQRLAAQVAPLQKELQELRRERDFEYLVGEVPELAEQGVADQTAQLARQLAEQMGQPALADDPKFMRLAFFAARAVEQHGREGSDGPVAAHLEGGAGATQGGSSQVDRGDLIVNAGGAGRRVLPFG